MVLLISLSCDSNSPVVPGALPSEFYDISFDNYWTYDVTRIKFDLAGPDTSIFQLREEFIDSIPGADLTTYILQRSVRDTQSDPWIVDSLWTVRFQNNSLVVVENNTAFVKLASPVRVGTEWDGNALNSQVPRVFYYQEVPDTFNTGSFESEQYINMIIEDIPENLVNHDERSEVYGKGIGLIQKNYITLNFCTTCPVVGEIEDGLILRQQLIEYGKK